MNFFAIGDLHIQSMEQAKIFANYLNSRAEDLVILLGDVIHFENSVWNPSKEMSVEEKIKSIPIDVSIWIDLFNRFKKPTLYYLGSHEMFALRVIYKTHLLLYEKIHNEIFRSCRPENLQIFYIRTKKNPFFITGMHIPDNIYSVKSEEFPKRKKQVEELIENEVKDLNIRSPEKTFFCTHDPTDFYYRNMGYRSLTSLLQKIPFKAHYHAHIHSNIRNTTIGSTPSINRSFMALSKFEPKALEPYDDDVKAMFQRNV